MPSTLLSRILPQDISQIIYNLIKLEKLEKIYWEKLYSPASFIVNKLVDEYSNYSSKYYRSGIFYIRDDIMTIIRITNKVASQGLIEKNIYILMDEYIDNLYILKKHLEYHFKYSKGFKLILQELNNCLDKFAH
tara:strand:- start:269 stop:670 length:402 start_codon:yes stop_codon:yes gene_type:complete